MERESMLNMSLITGQLSEANVHPAEMGNGEINSKLETE